MVLKCKAMRGICCSFRRQNTTYVADFINVMAEEASELPLPTDVTLEEAMNSWILQGGYPFISVIRDYEKGTVIIYQVKSLFAKSISKKFVKSVY